jgi:anthraniloyl-CoA monooxygenase
LRITIVGGGPAGLYFAILMKKADPAHEVTVLERNAPHQTFGWGVVFSDETMSYLQENDAESYEAITRSFAHWNDIDTFYRGRRIRSGGHGFSGIARRKLLEILEARAQQLGVTLRFHTEVEDIAALASQCDLLVGADGLNSRVRRTFESVFVPDLDLRKCRYMWLGTTLPFDAFTFIFGENDHGIFQVHAYRFDKETSTFIVECDEQSWRNAGLDRASTEESIAYLGKLFADHLGAHRVLAN